MTALYPGILDQAGDAGWEGEYLEQCAPLAWPGQGGLSLSFFRRMVARLVAASYRPPELLRVFGVQKPCVVRVLAFAKEAFAREETVVDVVVPYNGTCHVVGDLHGDLHSLMEVLVRTGLPGPTNVLVFAGDCVDRGSWGVEVLLIVFLLKLLAPTSVFLIRGNHETTGTMIRYGFTNEVERKYDSRTYRLFVNTVRELPCAAILRSLPVVGPEMTPLPGSAGASSVKRRGKRPRYQRKDSSTKLSSGNLPAGEGWRADLLPGEKRVMVVHGGLFRAWNRNECNNKKVSARLGTLEDLAGAHRSVDDPCGSIIEDVLWSDPQLDSPDVAPNELRGAGILYGRGAVEAFFKKNRLCGLVRAHEGPDMREKREGLNDMLLGWSVDMEFVSGFVATVFSAADYPPDCPRKNSGAFCTFSGRGITAKAGFIPDFTEFTKRAFPTHYKLFYNPRDTDRPSTPREGF